MKQKLLKHLEMELWDSTKVLENNEKKDVKSLKCNDWDLSGKKFIKEGQIMRKLKHNNVATIEKNMFKATLFFDGLLLLRFFQVWSRRSSTFV